MEVAAAIVGLGAVGAHVFNTLNSFIDACQDAPILAETTRDEIRDFHYALERLKEHVWQRQHITPLGRATTNTTQLVHTLTSSMKTFGHVEKILNPLLAQPKMDPLRRFRWVRSSGDIEKLLVRIQNHKLTIILLLTIWASESTAQAEATNDHLNDILKRLTDPNHHVAQMQHFDPTIYEVPTSDTSVETSDSARLEGFRKGVHARSFVSVGKSSSIMSGRSLTSKLRNSKAYASARIFDTIAQSVLSRGATLWSSYIIESGASAFSLPFSGLELDLKRISQVKEIHRISFPLDGKTIYNEWWYPKVNTKSEFPAGDVCTFLAILGLKGKTQKPEANRSPPQPTDIKSTIIPPSLIRTSDKELGIYITKGGTYSSFLKERLNLAIANRHLALIELLLVWSAQNRFGVSIGDELVDAFRGVVEQGDTYLTELFLNWGAYIEVLHSEPDHSIFQGALKSHHRIEMVNLFLVYGADTEKGYGEPSYTPLQAAAMGRFDHSLDLAEFLLDRGVNIKGFCDEERRTPLELATESANYNIATMLLDRGADPEMSYGDPPCTLLQAAAKGQLENSPGVAQFLLERGINIAGCCKEEHRTPIELAMASANYEMITMLLDRGVDPEKSFGDPACTPLQAAAMGQFGESIGLAQFLLDRGVNVEGYIEQEPRTPLQIASDRGDHNMINLLFKGGADLNTYYGKPEHTPLQSLIERGTYSTIRLLLEHGANVERGYMEPRRTPLQAIAEMIPTDFVNRINLLLDWGAKLDGHTDQEPRTPLQVAITLQNLPVAIFLIDRGANVEGNHENSPMSPLQLATTYGNKEVATLLLDRGANTDRPTGRVTSTPLQIAIQEGNTAIAKLLVDRGANIDAHTHDEPRTPLQIALGVVNLPMAIFLIDQGANVNGNYDSSSMVPLQLAAKYGSQEIVTELLDRGAEIDISTSKVASRPLQIAVQEGHAEIVQLLIARGANMEATSKGAPKTPLQIAVETQSRVIVWILLEGGAELHRCRPEYVCPIHTALKIGSRRIVEMLSTQGVNLVDVCYEESHL